jgi:hypothetical protein
LQHPKEPDRLEGLDSSASHYPGDGKRPALPEIEGGQDQGWHEPPRPRRDLGRPTLFGLRLVDRICDRLADGEPLARICREPGMPDRATVQRWRQADPAFDAMFRIAQEEGWRELAHQLVAEVEAALAVGASVKRVRLIFDVRRWVLARQAPEFFGSGRAKRRRERMLGR